jgi:hypothetical protein
MADIEGWNVITNGTSVVVGVLTFNTGVATSGPALGQPIFAAINGIRTDGTTTSQAHPLPVVLDSTAEGVLSTIAANTAGGATVAAQTAGNVSLATVATAQGAGATGIAQPTGGSGLLGWMSGLFGSVGAAATGIAQPTGGSGILGFLSGLWGSIGVAGTGISQPTGGTGLLGMLSGIYSVLLSVQTVKVTSTAVPLDLTATGAANTAVNILNAGHAIAGGFIIPSAAGFVNQMTNAGTTGIGSDIPLNAGQPYTLQRSPNAVSYISNTPTVTFSGYGGT